MQVIKGNPYIDEVISYKTDTVPADELDKYWDDLSKQYDKFINLSGSIEEGLLIRDNDIERIGWSKEKRHKECNVNYYDRTLELGGYPEIKGRNGELYFSDLEEKLARQYRKKYKNKFLILWSLSGSSMHKAYPYAHHVTVKFLNEHPDSMTITVGDEVCRILEWEHHRAKCYSGKWPIRKAMIMTKYADLVVGTETGILHAAACYLTPKIIMLSHSSTENLSKYWENCVSLHSDARCYPCHRLHYQLGSCVLDEQIGTPICMSELKAQVVYDNMEKVYQEWKK